MITPLHLQIAANLLSLAVALWLHWSAALILVLYWAENVVVAFWQVPRILLAGGSLTSGLAEAVLKYQKGVPPELAIEIQRQLDQAAARVLPRISNFFVAAFFLVHYGLFTYGHGVFVFALFLHQDLTVATLQEHLGNAGMGLALLGLMISHGVDFLRDLRSGRLARANPGRVMSEPYHRIVILHLVVMGSGLLLVFLPYPAVGLVLLTLIKSGMDIYTYRKQQYRKDLAAHVPQL